MIAAQEGAAEDAMRIFRRVANCNLRNLRRTGDGAEVAKYLEELREKVMAQSEIRVLTVNNGVISATNIAGNDTDIATNVTDIATNATDITGKVSKAGRRSTVS